MTTTQPQRDRPLGETSGSSQRPARRLTAAALDFDLAGELASLQQEASYQRGDRNGRTLVEAQGFRVILTALKAGTRMPEHHTDGWVSIHVLRGHLQVHASGRLVDLETEHVLVLDRNVAHDVEALGEDSAFLLTVATPMR